MTELEFETLLARGHETRGVEFKAPGNRNNQAFLGGVARAVLGMANRRGGGLVIIGVESDTESVDPVGLDEVQLRSWLQFDDLSAAVNEYATPSVSFDVEPQDHLGNRFIVIRVYEFEEIPVLCRKDLHAPRRRELVLRRGACYVRSHHKPETSEIPSEQEMRELLELAIDKGVRKFVTRAREAGMIPPMAGASAQLPDQGSFEKQLKEME
ncbi:MAG: helix-turn-helix domain-containing protein [Isosphaeraceae bacterium]